VACHERVAARGVLIPELAYPGPDAINLGRPLSLPIEGDRVTGIRQTSGEFAPVSKNRRTSADFVCSPFPGLARRSAEEGLSWRDAPWLARLFTTLTFAPLLALSRIDDLTRRAFYEFHCLKERWSVRELQLARSKLNQPFSGPVEVLDRAYFPTKMPAIARRNRVSRKTPQIINRMWRGRF
jgi:hypothetical protein